MSIPSDSIVGRHSRAIRLLTCLQAGPAFNAKELSQKLKVSRRTIYRDLNLIRGAGIDVRFDGQDSGYRIDGGPERPLAPPNFSDRDLAKLVLTSHLSVLNSWPAFAASLRESSTRMLANYPRQIRDAVSHVVNCCGVEMPPPAYRNQSFEMIETLLGSIVKHKQVRLELENCATSERRNTTTQFSVYRLIAGLEDWSVIGRSSLHRRTVRIPTSSIRDVQLLEDNYSIPHAFRSRLDRYSKATA